MPWMPSARGYWMVSRIQISGGICLLLAAFVLTVPLPWLLAAIFAALFHELGHLILVWLLGGKIEGGKLGTSSMDLHIHNLSSTGEIVAALAGPLASLCLVCFWRSFPRVAVCGGFQFLYNLLPMYPMDGGRILSCLLPRKICRRIAMFCRMGLILLGLWLCFGRKLGLFPMLLTLLLLIRTK